MVAALLPLLGTFVGTGRAESKDILVSITSFKEQAKPTSSLAHLGTGSKDAVLSAACAPHSTQSWSSGACVASLRRLVSAASAQAASLGNAARLEAEAQQLQEAETFVSQMFAFASKNFAKSTEALETCKERFEGDTGSVVRCLVMEGHPKMALKQTLIGLKELLPLHRAQTLPSEQRPTLALLEFARAHLTETVGPTKGTSKDQFSAKVADLHAGFLRLSGQLHSYNPQLALLMHYSASRLRALEPKHQAELYLVRTDTVPQFLMSPLHPLKDTHLSVDLLQKGNWERETSAMIAAEIRDRRPSHPECVLVDVGANVGWFTMFGAALGCQVVSYEPVAEHCVRIRYALAASGLLGEQNGKPPRVMLYEAATLSDPNKSALKVNTFSVGPAATSYIHSGGPDDDPDSAATTGVRVDDTVFEYLRGLTGRSGEDAEHLKPVHVLKIDAEGCELEALVSAERLLTPFSRKRGVPPELFVELCPELLHRCPGDWERTLDRSAQLLAEVYPRWFIYIVHGADVYHEDLFTTWSWTDSTSIPWSDWGANPVDRLFELRHGAKNFKRYVKEKLDKNGCVYLWARTTSPSKLEQHEEL